MISNRFLLVAIIYNINVTSYQIDCIFCILYFIASHVNSLEVSQFVIKRFSHIFEKKFCSLWSCSFFLYRLFLQIREILLGTRAQIDRSFITNVARWTDFYFNIIENRRRGKFSIQVEYYRQMIVN